jgi:hypothetical protein
MFAERNSAMIGPSWLARAFAVVMLVTAAYCVARLIYARARQRPTDHVVDTFHIVMGVAMAVMLVPSLGTFSARLGFVVFGAATAWFVTTMIRSLRKGQPAAGHSGHLGHALASVAMVYMFWAMPAGAPYGAPGGTPRAGSMSMPGMAHATASEQLPALGLVLGLGLLGYAWATTLRLAGLSTAATGSGSGSGTLSCGYGPRFLAPRLAACCEVAMAVVMAYLLIGLAG